MVNPDHILSTVYARLNEHVPFMSEINTLTKGAKRPAKKPNPTATVHLLTSPIDGETDAVRCTVVVNIYLDDLKTGEMDSAALGKLSKIVADLFHKAYDLEHPNLVFKSSLVLETLSGLKGDGDDEHFASVRIRMIVKSKGGN